MTFAICDKLSRRATLGGCDKAPGRCQALSFNEQRQILCCKPRSVMAALDQAMRSLALEGFRTTHAIATALLGFFVPPT